MQKSESVYVKSRRLIGENQKFNIYFDHVVDQHGFEVNEYLVVSPKIQNGNLVTGVAILPIMENKIGLIKIYRPALRDYSWEIPHGFIEEDEENKDSAIRELMEETGLSVKTVKSLGFITPDGGVLAARVHIYLAEHCNKIGELVEAIGLREFRFFTINEFKQMIVNSEIQDTFTLSAWCKYQIMKK